MDTKTHHSDKENLEVKPEYREGPEVAEKFEEAMKILFRTPKPKVKKQQPKAATSRKLKNRDKD